MIIDGLSLPKSCAACSARVLEATYIQSERSQGGWKREKKKEVLFFYRNKRMHQVCQVQ